MSRVRILSDMLLQSPRYIKLSQDRIDKVAQILSDFKLELPQWDFPPIYPQSDNFEEMCQFYLTFNAINYCYFDEDGKKFEDGKMSGSTLAATRLTEHWEDIKRPEFLSNVDENYLLADLFCAEGPISLVKERTNALREVGRFINENTSVTNLFEKLFHKYKSDAYFISQALPTHLPTWRDPFFKRAQLFVGMVYGRFQHWKKLPIEKDSLKDLTVFADYRVPETLIRMGIICPSAPLLTRIHQQQLISSGSRKELELRAATILGADGITEALNEISPDRNIYSLHTDFLLWSAGRKLNEAPKGLFVQDHITHHYTMTTDY